ncbi:MAG: nicotinate (nicotinamide) nucleotide adenylyltransferase [Clostridia bacterium]|nr:nicotinate (nicotinamide) nucleotide adenylyltransferase [Clostridia bacterium]
MDTEKERLGIYGGTFSPIHSGHVKAAYAFLDTMALDRLLVIPTAIPPHKAPVEGASAADRIEMARLAFCDGEAYKSGRLVVSDYETTLEGKSYTVYTLEHFASPECELYLLVGTDMFLTLDRWYRAEEIFRLADIVLMRRERDAVNFPLIRQKSAEYRERFNARIHEIDEPPIVVSSTELRKRLCGRCGIDGLIPEAVVRYIEENDLYR